MNELCQDMLHYVQLSFSRLWYSTPIDSADAGRQRTSNNELLTDMRHGH